ncbi:M16 family metallopeptidase [Anaeromyxobacter oryzae]|uniref:Peptidase M16 n=1 Tax=Anaeromyxobacter oryzae TaxID=2918170 RepID=A0ABM7WVT0_9BACT|nr:pitrilysin family protein [Anaeromyxobacter oryzae]BDG03605.1 peptidase M16 [Anaeromyxobacter oryzae]
MHALVAAAVAILLSAEPGNPAAEAPRESPPPPGPTPAFRLPALRRFTLDNGLQVTLVTVGQMPKVTVQLAVRIGTGDEAATETGLAKLVADMLVEGTKTRSAPELAALAARWGGSVETAVTADETTVGGTVLSEFAPDLVALVADVARNPAFPEKELERVRTDRIREITIARTIPQTLAQERFLALTYPGHAYGRLLPTPEQVKGYARADVVKFHAASFGAGRAHLYVAGRFDAARTEAAIREAFAGWARGAPRQPVAARPASKREVNLVERPGAVQSTLYVGLPVLDPRSPDYLKLVVTNTLLGGYFSSRMTANLREAKGYTYSPRSLVSVRAGAPGYWVQVADVTTAVTGASLKEIFGEIDRLRAEPPTAKELQAVQAYLAGQYVLEVSRREGLIERLRFVDLHGLPETWLEQYVPTVKAVTPADVQAMARTWLDGSRMTVVVVGDRKEIEGQVKPFGDVVVAAPPRT